MTDHQEPTPVDAMTEARIVVEGHDGEAESLWDWLRHDPELRGRLRARSASPSGEAMGVPIELAVVLATTTPALVSALARSLSTWLVQRRSDVTIKVTGPDGRQVSLSGKRVADAEKLLRTILESAKPDSIDRISSLETSTQPDTSEER